MPKIECLIERVGVTPVTLEQFTYNFFPVPWAEEGLPSTSVCDVQNETHAKIFLSRKQFRVYDANVRYESEKPVEIIGFSIVPHKDGRLEGYRIETVDQILKLHTGKEGIFKPTVKDLIPFDTQIDAWSWIKEEVKGAGNSKNLMDQIIKEAQELLEAESMATKEVAIAVEQRKSDPVADDILAAAKAKQSKGK